MSRIDLAALRVLILGGGHVTMVQSSESRERFNLAASCSAGHDWPSYRSILRKPEMSAVLVIVAYIFGHEPLQVPLIKDDNMVQQVSSTTPNPTLGDSVLPGTAECGANRLAS